MSAAAGATFEVAAPARETRADRLLEGALLAQFLIHAAAMVSMALVLIPGMPGGPITDDLARVTWLAEHPWRFRAGWVAWHVTAAVDLIFAIALLRARWIPRLPAWITLIFTAVALVPDQGSQLLWITHGLDLARAAAESGDLTAYLGFERAMFPYLAGWAALFYTLAGVGWSFCFAGAGAWSPRLSRLSVFTWAPFLVVALSPIVPPAIRPPPPVIAAGNAVAFILMQLWFMAVGEALLRRSRHETRAGAHAPWRHPDTGLWGRLMTLVANSRFVRAVCERLPLFHFASDITDVVYVNYLVPAERLLPLVPDYLELDRLGPGGQWALFTFLTYNHGHFGPTILGPLRRLFPSPVQSNWRIHVVDPQTGRRGIFFVTNAITTDLHALGARLMSEGMPMHRLARGEVRRAPDGAIHVALDPGAGTAPDAAIRFAPAASLDWEAPWSACFASFRDFLAYCVPQDRALASQPWRGTVSRQEIDLGIPLDACEPLAGEVHSRAAAAIAGEARPVGFRVAKVSFRFTGETLDPR